MTRFFSVHRDLFEGKGSGVTSQIFWIGDAVSDSLHLTVAGDGSSDMTVKISNANGRDVALTDTSNTWSNHSVVEDPNAFKTISDIPEGTRWIHVLRSESAMTATVTFQSYA